MTFCHNISEELVHEYDVRYHASIDTMVAYGILYSWFAKGQGNSKTEKSITWKTTKNFIRKCLDLNFCFAGLNKVRGAHYYGFFRWDNRGDGPTLILTSAF